MIRKMLKLLYRDKRRLVITILSCGLPGRDNRPALMRESAVRAGVVNIMLDVCVFLHSIITILI
jgi:hypothetical protein